MAQSVDAELSDPETGATSYDAALAVANDRIDRPRASRPTAREANVTRTISATRVISVVIVDKSPLFRAGITHLLADSRYRVKVSCATLQELPVRGFSDQSPIFLLSLGRDLRNELPSISSLASRGFRILLIGEQFSQDEIMAGIAAGVRGYLWKNQITVNVLLRSLDLVHLGGAVVMGPFADQAEVRLPLDIIPVLGCSPHRTPGRWEETDALSSSG